MSLAPKARIYWLPLAAIGMFFVLLFFSLLRLSEVEKAMRNNVDENMLWVITQAQVASHRFQEAIHRHAMEDPAARPQQRLDVLFSRLTLMDDGPQRRYIRALGLETLLDESLEHLTQLDASLNEDLDTADALDPVIQPLLAKLNRMANAIMMAEWEATGDWLDAYHDSLMQVIYSAIGILVTGLLLALLLLWALLKRRQAQKALTNHLDHLEDVVSARTRELQDERQRLADSINTAPDGFASFAANGQLQLVNAQLDTLVPQSQQLFTPVQPLKTVIHKLCHACASHSGNLNTDQPSSQCDMELNGGQWRQITLRQTPSGGHVMRVADITPYKQAAIALENALERERGVSDFYRSFAAMVSHQFRTSLAVIDSGLQRLMRRHKGFTAPEREERYQRLRETVMHMTKLVDASLLTARLDAGQVSSHHKRHDLISLIQGICHLHQAQHDDDQPPINIMVLPPGLSRLMACCDKALTEQIIDNLLNNARKYALPDTPIEIELNQDGQWAYCRIRNQGGVIKASEQSKIFERFYRATNSRQQQGLGLGLNIARTLARIQQGELELISSSAEATVFQLRLPRTETDHSSGSGKGEQYDETQ
ncbi:HAMP domain-containing histidine kinase [Vreelandella aquamarina]|uniref:sensor histidine kinase n=1 Tax=Vreelandella aquamarina TaxID=77097 RepID=UPI003850013B